MAHSRVRQAFTIPEMDQITSQNERLLDEVFAEDFSSRLVSLDEMISRSENITTQFRAQVKFHCQKLELKRPSWSKLDVRAGPGWSELSVRVRPSVKPWCKNYLG